MKDNTDKNLTPDKSGFQVPQLIYGYPAPGDTNDEIDLGELLRKLASQYKLIVIITLLGTLISLAFALILPNIYRQEVIVSKPYESDISELNANGYTHFTAEEIFKRYYDELRSPEKLETYIIEAGYLKQLYPGSTSQENTLVADFKKTFTIEVLEPKPEEKGAVVTSPSMLAVRVDHRKEGVIANLLNDYIKYTDKMLIKSLSLQQKNQIQSELKTISRDIGLLRSGAKFAREAEIIRIGETQATEIFNLNNKIEALLIKAEDDKGHEIIAIDSAYKIAKKLNIKKPTSIADIGKSFQGLTSKTEITLSDKQELPLYLMGTEYLDAKRDELRERSENTPFVREYTSLKEEIKLVETDGYLEQLKNRKSDDPYITELPSLMSRKNRLESLTLAFNGVKTLKIEKNAKVNGKKLSPKRALIVIGGITISSLLALFIGIMNLVLNKKIDSR
jgi:LPS O-antigen subunit length determinant protein (WzzB/FepE family)